MMSVLDISSLGLCARQDQIHRNSKPYSAASTTPIAEAGPIRRVRRWSADDLCPIRAVHSHQLKEVSHADRDD
jgi:hypothetical protein